MDDGRVETYTGGAERLRVVRRRRRSWPLRLLLALAIAALIVAYVIYMSMGMPGMNHSKPGAGADADLVALGVSDRMLRPSFLGWAAVEGRSLRDTIFGGAVKFASGHCGVSR